MSSTESDPSEPEFIEETWDGQYDDPNAKIVLMSSDGVKVRLSAWNLKKKRAFVSDLHEVSNSGDTSAPIPLEAPQHVLRAFADLVSSSTAPYFKDLTTSDYDFLFQICDKMIAPTEHDKAIDSLATQVERFPWYSFVVASKFKNVPLAKAALSKMGGEGDSPATRLPNFAPGDLDEVRPSYILELIRCRLSPTMMYQEWDLPETEQQAYVFADWNDVAKKFSPSE
ncbi:hypothetical protein BCR39DRAFT_591240 [Naematelia encephala]|uniref:BTB domain-containing protein n=1 Tax=Naematelia encephala TaxID=71784 RepID=A0A1Y2AK63_9TREE|nr:hypothetical protein BCR39DRAFT_591240 [Naematelia encephala]